MNAHRNLARRGLDPRPESTVPARGSDPRPGWIIRRLGKGRTGTPVLSAASAGALQPRRSPDPRSQFAGPAVAGSRRGAATSRRIDPRWYQIAMLSALLGYGVFSLGFGLGARHIAAVIGTALAVQLACTRLWRLPAFDPLSALISGIGLCTLLRTNGVLPAMLAAALAIASKFALRLRGKHLFNPTNLALVVMLATGMGWISPGQYGHLAFASLLIVCMGLTVVNRAARSDVTLAFLGVYAAILFGRSLWLGEPLAIPLHRLQSGLLLQFAFNMISDPRTTPDSRRGRLVFGALVALGAGIVQFVLFRTNGPVWSLAVCALLVPLLDRWLPGPRHQWKPVLAVSREASKGIAFPAMAGASSRGIAIATTAGAHPKGETHETPVPAAGAVRGGALPVGRP